MNKEKNSEIVEEAFKNAFLEKDETFDSFPENWTSNLILKIKKDSIMPYEIEFEQTGKRMLIFSSIAAGIAAAIVIVSTMTFSIQSRTDFTQDISSLYNDNYTELPFLEQ